MSKKSSNFALEMKKKQYIYPTVEVIRVNSKLMQSGLGNPSNMGQYGPAPKRRVTDVF